MAGGIARWRGIGTEARWCGFSSSQVPSDLTVRCSRPPSAAAERKRWADRTTNTDTWTRIRNAGRDTRGERDTWRDRTTLGPSSTQGDASSGRGRRRRPCPGERGRRSGRGGETREAGGSDGRRTAGSRLRDSKPAVNGLGDLVQQFATQTTALGLLPASCLGKFGGRKRIGADRERHRPRTSRSMRRLTSSQDSRVALPDSMDATRRSISAAHSASASGSAGPSRLAKSSAARSARACSSRRSASAKTAAAGRVMIDRFHASTDRPTSACGRRENETPRLKRGRWAPSRSVNGANDGKPDRSVAGRLGLSRTRARVARDR